MWKRPPFDTLEDSLADPLHPIGMRMRAAYYLRQEHTEATANNHADIAQNVVQVLSNGLLDQRHGALMRHEFAYVMGQLRDAQSCDTLERVLANADDDLMVRHEAAEALGAIGAERSTSVIKEVMKKNVEVLELAETCQLALNVMEWRASGGESDTMPAACACMLNPYSSIDPAPAHPAHANKTTEELGNILMSVETPMFERYRAMFSLRNRGDEPCVLQLCRALTDDTSSALLRHEVAYVLGQMQHPASIDALEESLRRVGEHCMVRHESAEALGAIDGGRWDDVEKILKEFTYDEDVVVRESCLVALDAADYWGHVANAGDALVDVSGEERSCFALQKADGVLVNHFNLKE